MKQSGQESRKRWYVAIARPHMDERVGGDLVGRGYEVFLPWTFTREKSSNKAWVEVTLRLSPYVFVAVDESRSQNLRVVAETNGVIGIVSLDSELAEDGAKTLHASEIPGSMIDAMRREQIADFEEARRRVRRKDSLYSIGETIEVRSGEFNGYSGKVIGTRPGSIIAEIGPNRFPVWLPETDVAPASASLGKHGRQAA